MWFIWELGRQTPKRIKTKRVKPTKNTCGCQLEIASGSDIGAWFTSLCAGTSPCTDPFMSCVCVHSLCEFNVCVSPAMQTLDLAYFLFPAPLEFAISLYHCVGIFFSNRVLTWVCEEQPIVSVIACLFGTFGSTSQLNVIHSYNGNLHLMMRDIQWGFIAFVIWLFHSYHCQVIWIQFRKLLLY